MHARGAKMQLDAPAMAGLDSEEATRRLATFGPNRFAVVSRWRRLLEVARVLADPMALMLAGAGGVYLALGEVKDGVILFAAIAPVLAVDVLLEARSRKALEKLAAATRPRARVMRDGVEREIASEELVPGDVLLLDEGDVVHADGVVRHAANFCVDEAQLTGESEPLEKRALLGTSAERAEADQLVFAGSTVLTGQAAVELTGTGSRTRLGHIAHLVAASEPEPTPLQRKTGGVVRVMGLAAAGVALAVFLLARVRGEDVYHALLTSLSVAISAVPEEFPLVFTIFLSMGAYRLSRRGMLVRRLAAVETLGATTVICTDKTGTLTKGHFSVDSEVVVARSSNLASLREAALLACEVEPRDAMELALAAHARDVGLTLDAVHAQWEIVHDYDFDSCGKHMSHVWQSRADPGRWRICAKGALEGILEHCARERLDIARIEREHAELAAAGMRVLAVAQREADTMSGVRHEDERELELVGLIGFRDPLRPGVPRAVAECLEAGIRIKVVTGDHALTAHAIADAAGIPHDDRVGVVTGEELDRLGPAERSARIRDASIFARVRPEQKHGIVDELCRSGEVVAMTGDGINDAPALRRADIGISFGVRGTPVARTAADLVLLDDDFASLVATVREGRAIFENLQRAFLYLLSFKLRVVGLALLGPLVGLPAFFQPVHLVWLELIVHPVSAIVFEAEPPPPDLMQRPPRDPRAPLASPRQVARSLVSGVFLMIAALWAYAAHLDLGVDYARSLGVATVVSGSLLLVWAERAGDRPLLSVPPPRSAKFWLVWGGVAASLPLFMHVPAIAGVFQIVPLRLSDWALVAGVSAASIAWRAIPPRRAHRPHERPAG